MIFDISNVYTRKNADELHSGDIVCVADTMLCLKEAVENDETTVLDSVGKKEIPMARFWTAHPYFLAYLVCPARNAEAYWKWLDGKAIEIEYAELDENETSVWRLFENEDPNWCKFHYRPAPKEITKSVHQLVDNTKEYRPFNSIDELTTEFVKRFQTKTPSYALPLIWVKSITKGNNNRGLITGYIDNEDEGQLVKIDDRYYGLCVLFKNFQFLDGSPCGVEK